MPIVRTLKQLARSFYPAPNGKGLPRRNFIAQVVGAASAAALLPACAGKQGNLETIQPTIAENPRPQWMPVFPEREVSVLPEEESIAAPPQVPELPQVLPEGVSHYVSAADFVERAVLPINPRVVAWGEIHPDPGSTYTPTITRFAREILPTIAASGRNRLIIESLPSDQ
ncbi:MAG: hypothetical protein ABIH69_02600, partial [bacterium]